MDDLSNTTMDNFPSPILYDPRSVRVRRFLTPEEDEHLTECTITLLKANEKLDQITQKNNDLRALINNFGAMPLAHTDIPRLDPETITLANCDRQTEVMTFAITAGQRDTRELEKLLHEVRRQCQDQVARLEQELYLVIQHINEVRQQNAQLRGETPREEPTLRRTRDLTDYNCPVELLTLEELVLHKRELLAFYRRRVLEAEANSRGFKRPRNT